MYASTDGSIRSFLYFSGLSVQVCIERCPSVGGAMFKCGWNPKIVKMCSPCVFDPPGKTVKTVDLKPLGNRPLEPKASKVEFLKSERGFTDEEIKIYRQPDHGRFEAL